MLISRWANVYHSLVSPPIYIWQNILMFSHSSWAYTDSTLPGTPYSWSAWTETASCNATCSAQGQRTFSRTCGGTCGRFCTGQNTSTINCSAGR